MWETIRKLFRKISDFFSVAENTINNAREVKQNSNKIESNVSDNRDFGNVIKISLLEREQPNLRDDVESEALIYPEESQGLDGRIQFDNVDSNIFEEEIKTVENHIFNVVVDDVDLFDSDEVEVFEMVVDETNQIPHEEEIAVLKKPLVSSTGDKYLRAKLIKKDVVRKQKQFYFDFNPIPVLPDEKIDELIKLSEAGMLLYEFGYDSQKLEIFLLNVFKRYDLIGEIPFGQKSFEYFCDLIQQCYIKGSGVKITEVPPALYVASMVFCARYSEEEARKFWKPYAKIVWKTELNQYFQNVSRKHFLASKLFLQNNFDYVFPKINEGDVVRPIYYQAIIPFYLQSNFAEWLVDRFEQLLSYSIDDLPHVLQKEKSLDYVPTRLKNFVQQSETRETAAKLIRQMAKAVRLFQTTEQFETVNSVMTSPIERSLWREIYQELIEKKLQLENVRKYTPKLEWVWNLDTNDINLQLSQVRASKEERPDLIVWAKQGSHNLRDEEILLDVHPWQLANGDWELEPEYIPNSGDLDGKIYVLSEEFNLEEQLSNQDDHIILEKDIPELNNDIMFFFIPAQKSIAREKDKINLNGNWIILSKESVDILDHSEEKCIFENIYIPPLLRNKGFNFAKKYSLNLPVTLQVQGKKTICQHPQSSFVLQAELFGEQQTENVSPSIQPIFHTSAIGIRLDAEFAEDQLARTWVSAHRGGVFLTSISLAELQKDNLFFEDNGYVINLAEFIYEPGLYTVNILHDLQMLLEEDLRFAYLPDVNIIGPDPEICYSPKNPLEIILSGVDERQVKTGSEEKVKISQSSTGIHLSWKEVRLPKCRFSLQWEGNNVNFSWDINRVSAWIEGGGDKRNVLAGQEKIVILNARGESKEEIVWFIKDTNLRRKIQLDYKGEYSRRLSQTGLRDLLKSSHLVQSTVAITIRGQTWDVFVYNKIPSVNFKFVEYDKPYIRISLNQSERLSGDFIIQLRDTEKPVKPIMVSRVNYLEENCKFEVDLPYGKYQAEILLDNEILSGSQIFIVKEEISEIVQRSEKDILITKSDEFSSQKLFESLTSGHQELLGMKEKNQSNLILILQQLIKINSVDTWITGEKWDDGLKRLLPSWAVFQHPLRFQTKKNNRLFHIFPEQVVFGGKAGKGFMTAKLEHLPVKIYAAWNTDFDENITQLWLKILPTAKVNKYCELNEVDLWPAYQCIDCGIIVGSRSGNYLKLSPRTTLTHRHKKFRPIRDQFLDVVYKKPIEVTVSQYRGAKLNHAYWPNEIVGRNYFNDLHDGKMQALKGSLGLPINTYKPNDYYIAISEANNNYKNPLCQMALRQIIGKENLFILIKSFIIEKKDDVPAFSAILQIEKSIVAKQRLFFLPKYVLLLSLILRLKANSPQIYRELLERNESIENEIVNLAFQAMKGCPKLFEWSIAWAEILFIHAIS